MHPIAIVGQACVLPGALDPDALWQLALQNRSALGPAPAGRWGIARARMVGAAGSDLADRAVSDIGGYVHGFDGVFEPEGFAVPAPELKGLDPLFLWLLHVGRQALSTVRGSSDRRRTGAVVGNLSYPSSSLSRYAERTWIGDELAARLGLHAVDPRNRSMSGLPAHLLARALGLGGGAFALDAACASSLYAIKVACDALSEGRADVMLAGAVNRADDLFIHAGFTALGALSPTGQSRPFHRDADGLVPAEGAAMVALRRLEDAEDAGDEILGVIRGVGVSNDGRARGFLVPSEEGQGRALRSAYAQAGLSPAAIQLVECHATGTTVGDAIEVRALAQLFAEHGATADLGSLKANLGHLITVAGVAGLIKVLGALRHRTLPASPRVAEQTEALRGSSLHLHDAPRPWTSQVRRAAVSAFGFGGNNAHLLVEEAPCRGSALPRAIRVAPAVAIVSIGARIGSGASTADFAASLFEGAPVSPRATEITLPTAGLRFPPKDLEQTLPQQLSLLAAATEAVAGLDLPRERTAVFVGMQCDAEIARHGARWRLAEWAAQLGADDAWLAAARDAFVPLLGAAGVIGAMPNIPANRLSSHLDLRAMSFTVAAEELSGVRALELARQALERGEIDAAIVGAVDLSCEPVQASTSERPPGDAAVVMVLRRLADAPTVFAVLTDAVTESLDVSLPARFGHAHAASGLLQVATAALCCARGLQPDGAPWAGEHASVQVDAIGGQAARVTLRRAASVPIVPYAPAGSLLRFEAHRPSPRVPSWQPVQVMQPAPRLASVRAARRRSSLGPVLDRAVAHHAAVATVHRDWLLAQGVLQEQFLAQRMRGLALLQDGAREPMALLQGDATEQVAAPQPSSARLSGPTFSREQLEIHASGKISTLFGPAFAAQDRHAIQVRMPQPPLLLADRVVRLDAEPGSMGLGTVWTETDVRADSWFLNRGFMPAGVLIEAGQADLFLVSYLGVDALNRGERAYRLLGCELTYHGSLPAPGDTLRYDIHIDGHAHQGDVGLFFFHYDCVTDGRPVLTVREGQAGFFTLEELQSSAGVLWSPAEHVVPERARIDAPVVVPTKRTYAAGAVRAFSLGDLFGCFGAGFELGRAHVRTPSIQPDRMLLFHHVLELDPHGGPHGRGYLKVALPIAADDWFFEGHFKNDPCMPGTLMFEGCLQAMAFYLAALGHTLSRDGWRFEPVPEETYKLQCRGQVLPTSKELVCEVFVAELHDGPIPMLYADLLGTVDGHKAFHAKRVGLRLVPDWPLSDRPQLVTRDERPCAEVDGFRFDYASLLACAWGKPSHAFGPMYERFDGTRRVARLPGPPYHFMSRVVRIDGPIGVCEPGATIEIEYDVPPDAWYFAQNGGVMPFSVLLETVLQPCGWLASYVGSAITEDEDLLFRNLDGSGRVLAEIGPHVGTLRTVTTLKSISRSAGMILETFELECWAGGVLVCRLGTGFGFFPNAALENQVGLPTSAVQREVHGVPLPLDRFVEGELHLAGAMLRMIDRVTHYSERGGAHGLGFLRAEKAVDAGEWFFKAHFFQDPVQPGSLGIEAMLQLLQTFMLARGLHEGIAAPRFEAIAIERDVTWKYRGQVTPRDRIVSVTMDITETGRDERGVFALATASLWVDEKRIYEVTQLGMRIVGAQSPVERARTFWRRHFRVPAPPVDDLYRGLVGRFTARFEVDDPAGLSAAAPRGVLFLGNHQTAVESTIFAILGSSLTGTPLVTLAKIENTRHWLALLMKHTFAYPGLREPHMTEHFDRAVPTSLAGIIDTLGTKLREGTSVMVHVEGTRSLDCRQPVAQLSGSFLEMALAAGRPIVPVRFSGGLPVAPLVERLELPLGMGRQDYRVGELIQPEQLAPLDYRARRQYVIDAINALGVPNADEAPLAADPEFAHGVEAWMQQTGASLGHATLYRILEALADPSPQIASLLDGARAGCYEPGPSPEGRWMAELARRLFGERGPVVLA